MNFNPMIDFDGTTDYLQRDASDIPWMEGDVQHTFYSVYQSDVI